MTPPAVPPPPVHVPDAPVPSPCISVCRMNAASGLCEGCWRSIEEIAGWASYSDAQKRAVWRAIERRRG